MQLPDIRDAKSLKGKRVFLRSSLNVPVAEGHVVSDFRLKRALPTIEYLKEQETKVVVAGHIGREKTDTLKPVYEYFKEYFNVTFLPDIDAATTSETIEAMETSDVVLLENLRSKEGEAKNDPDCASYLASLADIYVNDAFAASHREHASVVGVPQHLPHYAGIGFQEEVKQLEPAQSPTKPAFFVLGGAKFETKQPLVEKFLNVYDRVFIGGALANDFFKAKGYEVGKSLVSDASLDLSHLLQDERVMLPSDVVVEGKEGGSLIKRSREVTAEDTILDIGPQTLEEVLASAKDTSFILWNGPFGNYERGFSSQTESFAQALAELDATTIVGGGDTVASIAKLNLFEKFNFVSTGGGAMLEFLERGTLPGIEALLKK